MKLLFLDDASQRRPTRDRVGPLVAVGGISIDAEDARSLELEIDAYCRDIGFPDREPFKWSPNRDRWMRENLTGERRVEFFNTVLGIAAGRGAVGQVVVSDSSKGLTTRHARNHEHDVLIMAMERFDYSIAGADQGMVIVARPSGGRGDEDNFLAECAELVTRGTDYANFSRLVMNVLTMPFDNSRLLQVADLVVSITTAMVAGHVEFAGPVMPSVRALMRTRGGCIGGVGAKINPDYCYANLYHWVLGDDTYWRRNMGVPYPIAGRPFNASGDVY